MISIEQEKKSRQTFLSVVSHELKTPITSLQGFIQALHRKIAQKRSIYSPYILISDADLSQYQNHLNTMLVQVKRLNRLVDDLLDTSVIDSGQMSFNWSDVEISSLLEDLCYQAKLSNPEHLIQLHFPSKTDCLVVGDESRLEKLFSNLISNAIKYSPDSKMVDVSIESLQDVYKISIQDYGIGINEDEKESIFYLYYRGRDVKRNKVSGVGLGLYLCKQIVDLHKGKLGFESEIGKGTTFFVELAKKQ